MWEMTRKLRSSLIFIHLKPVFSRLPRGKLHTAATLTSSVCHIHTRIITKQEVSQKGTHAVLFRLHLMIRRNFPAE